MSHNCVFILYGAIYSPQGEVGHIQAAMIVFFVKKKCNWKVTCSQHVIVAGNKPHVNMSTS